jgi:hypothetical protein
MATRVPEHDAGAPEMRRWIVYAAATAVFVVLLVIMVAEFTAASGTSSEATAKAKDLRDKLSAAGLRAPSEDQITRTLGADGGPVCEDPGSALNTAQHAALNNGAAGPGQRGVIAPREVVTGAELAISVYCPGKLSAFNDYVSGLKLTGKD